MASSIEAKWQERWEKSAIFSPKIDNGKKKYFITIPWPYTSGSLHVGHGRTYTLGDIISRYKRARGYNVLFPMAFHESGTPVLSISQKLKKGDPSTIALYTEYLKEYGEADIDKRLKEFEDPLEIATYFSRAIIHDFNKMGYSIDWSREFTSAEPMYQQFVTWQFNKLNSLGYLKRGDYPILFSIEDQNPVGEDDIKDGDTDKVSIEEFTGIVFKGESFSLAAGSLRPETIYGITNLWISDNGTYVLIRLSGQKVVVSENAIEKMKSQNLKLEVVRKIDRKEILSSKFLVPVVGTEVPVYETGFVDPDNATGIVYSVPAHSIMDYVALTGIKPDLKIQYIIDMPKESQSNVLDLVKRLKIKSIEDTDSIQEATQILYRDEFYSGVMKEGCGIISSMPVQQAREKIRNLLLSEKLAFPIFETSRKALTRSGSPVIVAIVKDQWFLDYSNPEWKKKSHALVDRMVFYPEYLKKTFNDAIDWLKLRPCARRRGLGTKLPMDPNWVIESLSDSTIYPAVYTNAPSLRKIYDKLGKIPHDILDYIFGSDDLEMPDIDDASISKLVEEAKRQKSYWYGVDTRLTTQPHISNHLSFYIMNHVALFSEHDFPVQIIISGIVTSKGAKIGKSKGNVVSLPSVVENYSADIFRMFVAVGADISTDLDWNENDVSVQTKKIEAFSQIMENYRKTEAPAGYIEKWFLSSFFTKYKSYIDLMDSGNIRGANVHIFHEVLNDLKYLERRGGRTEAVLPIIIKHWLVALMPVIPHLAEEYWHRHVQDTFVSLEMLPDISPDLLDESLLEKENYLIKVIEDIREIIKATNIMPSKIGIQVCGETINNLLMQFERNHLSEIPGQYKHLIPEYMKNRRNISRTGFNELDFMRENLSYLKEVFNCNVEVDVASIKNNGKNAWPGRPMIHLEK